MILNIPDGQCATEEQVRLCGEVFQEGFRQGLLQAQIMTSNMVFICKKDNQDAIKIDSIEYLMDRLKEYANGFKEKQ